MIECKKVSFSYPPNETDIGDREGHGTLRNIDLSINDGDFVLLCGTSGCGKTTLTRLFNGLIPHYYDGKLEGTVMLDGEDMSGLSLFDISKKVGSVVQNPKNPALWGIRNEDKVNWTYQKADGTQIPVAPGRTAGIAKGVKIIFPESTGEFK